jgi:hypothetical protein
LQGIAVLAVVVLFVLSFFPWVGVFPGGVPVTTQSAWQAGFGGHSVDAELAKQAPGGHKDEAQGGNGLLIVYALLLVPILLLTLGAGLLTVLPGKLPPWLERLKPWRWGIVAGVGLLAFVLLTLQLVTGFSVEGKVQTAADKALEQRQKAAKTQVDLQLVSIDRGTAVGVLYRTTALTWVFWLQLLLVICAAIVFRLERRPGRPMPRIDVSW